MRRIHVAQSIGPGGQQSHSVIVMRQTLAIRIPRPVLLVHRTLVLGMLLPARHTLKLTEQALLVVLLLLQQATLSKNFF